MNTNLIETARNNRIAALAYLQAKKVQETKDGEVLCLATMREKLREKPVFLTRRSATAQESIAA